MTDTVEESVRVVASETEERRPGVEGNESGAEGSQPGVREILSESDFKTAISQKLIVIDFYADWCGPCKMMSTVVDKFSKDFKNEALFYKIDVDKLSKVASDLGITAMPTFMLFKEGVVADKVVGANPTALKAAIVGSIKGGGGSV